MGIGRIPGPYGTIGIFGCVLNPGPTRIFDDFSGEFSHLTPGSMGIGNDLSATIAQYVNTPAKEDEEELKLLFQVYGSIKNKKGKSYSHWKKKKLEYDVANYVRDRDEFFGSTKAFQDYRDKLDAEEGKLRGLIEPPVRGDAREKIVDWKKAQDVFYVWVRKAYDNLPGDEGGCPEAHQESKIGTIDESTRKSH